MIGDGKFKIGEKLTIAMTLTLNRRNLTEVVKQFGALFLDEAHHLAARTFRETIAQFPAKYRFWTTATPERGDKLTSMLFHGAGPIIHEIDSEDLPIITPEVKVIKTQFNQVDDDFNKLLEMIWTNQARNQLIVDTIGNEAKKGNYLLVLSDRIKHIEFLHQELAQAHPNLSIELYHGKRKNRGEIMRRVKNKEVDILLATFSIAKEWLDIPHLNRLFLATPKKDAITVKQSVGRIMRQCEDKTDAIEYDFWDDKCPIVINQFWHRRRVYRKLNMEIHL